MSEKIKPSSDLPPKWQEDTYYFGNACDPSYVTYRTSEGYVQFQGQLALEYSHGGTTHIAELSEVEEMLACYSDCTVSISDGYTVDGAEGWVPRAVLLKGWRSVDTPEDLETYYLDKSTGSPVVDTQ